MSKKTIKLIESKILCKRIGLGGFAAVFKVDNKALKVFYKKNLYRHGITNEVKMLKNLKHLNIPMFYTTSKIDDVYPYILTEYIDGITLYELIGLNNIVNSIVPENVIKAILLQSAEVLSFLHSKNIVHRDITPTSFMISRNGMLKLIDFATAKKIKSSFIKLSGMNSNYQAPEQVINKITCLKSDVWSLGATIYHVFMDRQLFDCETINQIEMAKIIIPPCNHEVKRLIELILQKDPSKRISSHKLEQETKKLMSRQESERLIKDFVNYYLNSPTCQAYLEKARNSYPYELIFLDQFIKQARQERKVQSATI